MDLFTAIGNLIASILTAVFDVAWWGPRSVLGWLGIFI